MSQNKCEWNLSPHKKLLAGNPKEGPVYSVTVKSEKGTSYVLADPKATRAMISLMDMQAVMGGAACHFGGPSALAEIMSVLYGIAFQEGQDVGQAWHEKYHIINDAGHCENGIYALKANYGFAGLNLTSLKSFRSITSPLTGHGEAHLFPEGVYLSNGPLGSSLPQAEGLCIADALVGNDRVTTTVISDGACMEGEAREAFASIPGLAAKGKLNPFVLVISDNNTKLSGRIDEQSYDMSPTFKALAPLGWKLLFLENAHDIKACLATIEDAYDQARANPKQPVAIVAKTIKGYGVKKVMATASGGHGFPLKEPSELPAFLGEIYGDATLPAEFTQWTRDLEEEQEKKSSAEKPPVTTTVKNEKVQVGVASALVEKAEKGLPVISVTSDLAGSTGVAGFQKKFPTRVIDVGIAESNMVSVAAGLSKEGFIPIVDTFSQFGVTKGALPFIMAGLSQAPMIGIFSHAGFQDAADGASHQALSHFAMTSALPYVNVYYLSSSYEAHSLVGQAVERIHRQRQAGGEVHSEIFFLGRENFPQWLNSETESYELGKAQVIYETQDIKQNNAVTVVAVGPMLTEALVAVKDLEAAGVGVIIVNPSIINKPDLSLIKASLAKTQGRLICIEDHQSNGGMGSILVHQLVEDGVLLKLKSLALKGQLGQSAYKAIELYEKHGLDSKSIVKAAKSLL